MVLLQRRVRDITWFSLEKGASSLCENEVNLEDRESDIIVRVCYSGSVFQPMFSNLFLPEI